MTKVTGMILVAGNSTRYGKKINKNFELINGRAILSYSLREFLKNDKIEEIVLVIRKQDEKEIKEIVSKEDVCKDVKITFGGKTRQESVYNGLQLVDSDIVIIHDGARPCVKQEYIDKCIEVMKKFKGATIAVKAKDTIKIANEEGVVVESTKRENTWVIQTPQCFDARILKELHNKYRDDEVTDDCMLLEKEGYDIKLVDGDYTNIKVTTSSDYNIVQEFLNSIVN